MVTDEDKDENEVNEDEDEVKGKLTRRTCLGRLLGGLGAGSRQEFDLHRHKAWQP